MRPKLLIVDDRRENRLALRVVLDGLNYQIFEAASGKEALKLILQEEFSLVLLDVNMPEMDGFETASLIRERRPRALLPMLFISAREPNEADHRRAYSLGAVDYVTKPLVREVLRAKVSALLDLQQRAESLEGAVRERTKELKTLNERADKLRETVAELEAFSYSISHDMRGPLRSISAYSKMLEEDFGDKLPAEAKIIVQRINASSARLAKMIADVLAFSRITLEPVFKTTVELEQLVDAVIEHDSSLQPPNVEIRVNRPLPKVMGHEACMTQCISNLLCNAVKFVAPGRRPQVNIRAEELNSDVRIWFEDNGIGIVGADRQRIFEPFQRLNSTASYEGTGLGLAIVRKAIEKMGGQFGVESEVGVGSRFWIQLSKG